MDTAKDNNVQMEPSSNKLNTEKEDETEKLIKSKYSSNINYMKYANCSKYILCVIVICTLLYFLYNNFYNQQLKEPFIEKTIKSDPAVDLSFDKFNVADEVCSLKKKQEGYLLKLNKERNF
jgi:hypothetical protein